MTIIIIIIIIITIIIIMGHFVAVFSLITKLDRERELLKRDGTR
jgi:CBS domain containing-hemolysin-like protein